ncbi:hypothetical protein [Helicobacter cinaedi]|nr:hypothetical protein [Helicobacter cinaedi]
MDKNALDSNRFHKKQNLSYLEARLLWEKCRYFQNGNTIVDNRVDI